jgi:hypothetical protein
MSQTSYNFYQGVAILGMKIDARDDHVDSKVAAEAIEPGRALIKVVGVDNKARKPKANKGTLVLDADLITANVVNGNVNGTGIAPVTFAVSHLNTMGLLVTAIKALTTLVADAYLDSTDATNRTIIIRAVDGLTIATLTSWAVTAGATQANIAATALGTLDNENVLEGIAMVPVKEQALGTGIVIYAVNDIIPSVRKGAVFGLTEQAVTMDDPVYIRFYSDGTTGTAEGQFRKDSDSGKAFAATGLRFRTSASAGAVVAVEINKP